MAVVKIFVLFVVLIFIQQASCAPKRVGGWQTIPTNSTDAVSIAVWTADQLGAKLYKVLFAERQVVAGLLYKLKLLLFKGKMMECLIEVWSKPWLHMKRLVYKKCTSPRYYL